MWKKLLAKKINEPDVLGSYSKYDVIFLLKNIGEHMEEKETEDREEIMQNGGHYSEMLPIEYRPTPEYMTLFFDSLEKSSDKITAAVKVVSEEILEERGRDVILVSLARAGTPYGILIKRYLKHKYGIEVPHYSISIIRGKGIDENALIYILKKHGSSNIQFVDGWTGKGAITKVLSSACKDFYSKYDVELNPELAVLADPGSCSSIYGTREDFLLPSACLNSTVSGLISRTVHRKDLVGEDDFHGVKYYYELIKEDVSNLFIDRISSGFDNISEEISLSMVKNRERKKLWLGLKDVERIKKDFEIDDINLIKPGIGETTRVLLRRVPWKILINSKNYSNLGHIILLAKEKGVEIVEYDLEAYQCCGIVKNRRES